MAISFKHAFTSAKIDGGDSTLIQPSNWNAEHVLTLAAGKVLGRDASGAGAAQELNISVDSTGQAMTAPSGDTASRPASPTNGMFRYNTTLSKYELYNGTAWGQLPTETTTGAVTFGTIELGNASDTTLSRVSAGVAAIEGKNIALNGTTETFTTGTIELGNASDTTISRVSAGVAAIEGKNIALQGTAETVTFGNIEIGAASDTTITRSAAGVIAVEGGVVPKENRANTFSAANTFSNANTFSGNNSFTGTNTFSGVGNRITNTTNCYLQLDTLATAGPSVQSLNINAGINGPDFSLFKGSSNSSFTTTGPAPTNGVCGTLGFYGFYDTGLFTTAGQIISEIVGTVSSTNTFSSKMSFLTTISGVGTSAKLILDQNGYALVGYTASNGAYRLQVNSQIFATSATIATSDGRYKENVAPLSGALDAVMALNPVQFDWKEHPVHNFDREQPTVGFIAQEVQQVLADKPYLNSIVKGNVCTLEKETFDEEGNVVTPAVTEEFLGIAEGNMIPLLTKAIQELKAEFDAYKASHP